MVITTHDHEISGWTIPSILLHAQASNLGGINDVQSDPHTLTFNNGERLNIFIA